MKITNISILFLVFFLSISTTIISQNTKIDSLKIELKTHIGKDSTRVNLLNAIAYKNYGFDQDQLKKYADEAYTLAKEIKFVKGEARSWYLNSLYYLTKRDLGSAKTNIDQSLNLEEKRGNTVGISKCYNIIATICRFQEDYDKSILFYNKALQIEKDEDDQLGVADILSNIGVVYNTMGELDDAETVLKKSIAIYDSLNAKTKILNAQNNLALVYTQQGRHTEALGYYQKCLTAYREQGNKIFGASILLNISLVYSSIDETDKALPYLEESLELSTELENELYMAHCITGIGYVYRSKKKYDKAIDYYNEALIIYSKIESKEGLYNCYSNIGGLHIEKEEYDLALESFKKGLEVSLDLGNKRGIAESYTELGVIHYHLGNYKKALEHLQKGNEIADELSLVVTQKEANLFLSKLSEQKNNHVEALERFKEHKMYSDSLFNKENIEKITQLEYEYKYKQKLDSASIRELKLTKTVTATNKDLEKTKQNYLWAIIVSLLTAILLGGIIFYQKLRNVKSKTQNIIIEQKLLRSQMTPHFIFNSLSVLQGMILNKEEEKSVYYLSKFSKLLRIILENSRDKTVSLAQELKAIQNYLSLQNLENDAYHYTVLVEENIEIPLFEVPPMLIQPFVENAIEHAFVNQKENKRIDIRLTYLNKKMICTIIDNGIGVEARSKDKNVLKKSLSTTITSDRLKILSKDFKMEGSINIEDRKKDNEQGTIVTLVIPHKILVA